MHHIETLGGQTGKGSEPTHIDNDWIHQKPLKGMKSWRRTKEALSEHLFSSNHKIIPF